MSDLKHFGILGMHWGKRKSPEQVIQERQKSWEKKVPSHFLKAYNAAAGRMNNGEISRINNKPEYKDKNFNLPENKELNKKYVAEHEAAFHKALVEEMNKAAGPSPSGKHTIDVVQTSNGYDFYVKNEEKSND